MNKYWKLISNTLIFAIGTFSSKVLVFLLMPLYTTVLTDAEYGTVDLMVQVGNFLLPLVSCGIVNGIIRFGLDKYYRKRDVFTTGFLTILGGFVLLLILEPILVHVPYLNENTMMIYVFVLMSSMRSLCSQFVHSDEEIVEAAQKLQQQGARNVLVSMAGAGAILLDENGTHHKISAPKGTVKHSVGAGDSMVAGFLSGYLESGDYAVALKMGTATGSATAFSDGLATGEEARALFKTL